MIEEDDEYALKPTGSEEGEDLDYGDASPDHDLDNADWPKRTPDTDEALAEAVAAQNRTPFISGSSGWYAWFDLDTMDWESDDENAPLKMIREGFGEAKMNEYIEADKTRRELYGDVIAFLDTWGVKASIVD